ncbi:metal-sensing transcriptional repressor [Adlercreutzia sp. ZJ141]|uniref:metal-sensing transcriptional repressor n=1 Tax=Adlercreutzia sp. ZJ141 TaxID=2709406 RepID=UPI0013E9ED19|nr:metal-sensing transcriptional repressor [Adlercreutzia sp. ZJ141]
MSEIRETKEKAAEAAPCENTAQQAGTAQQTAGEAQQCGCHHKATPRSDEFKADLQRRLNRAIGQLGGVKNMLDDNRYCGDVLVQLAAAESAVRSVSMMLLQDHMETCVVEQIRQGNDEVVTEAMQLVKRFAR